MVCCGYDVSDSTYLFYNSYGTRWGNNGYFRVTARTLRKNCTQAYVFNGGVDRSIEPPARRQARELVRTDTTSAGRMKEGDHIAMGSMRVVISERDAKNETVVVQLVDTATNTVRETMLLHDEVPRAVVIDDRLWTIRFAEPRWLAGLFGAGILMAAEVDADDDEALEQRMDRHFERFRQR